MARIIIENVCFSYPIYDVSGRSLKLSLARQFAGGKINAGVGQIDVAALSNISMAIRPGDRIGLVGRNGSGKSTLLRLLAGLAFPTSGRIAITGRVIPLIEKGLGINPELTGSENVELPMRLLGATNAEVRHAREEVAEFTGLGGFMNMPVRTYSAGMFARLAFALCTAVEGDILVLDEWIGAGDIDFVERAQQRLNNMLASAKIVVLATHSIELMKAFCTRVVWIDRGLMIMDGDPNSVIGAYQQSALQAARE